jgi:hypothetical protein
MGSLRPNAALTSWSMEHGLRGTFLEDLHDFEGPQGIGLVRGGVGARQVERPSLRLT